MSLADARAKRDAMRRELAAGRNPSETRKQAERDLRALEFHTFEAVARALLVEQERTKSATVKHHLATWNGDVLTW